MARIVRLIRMVRANAGHVALALALALAPGLLQPAHAAGFAVIASPARFEIAAQAGETVRQVLELSNVATEEVRLELRSADWSFDPDSNVVFHEALQADSCRPWVALEKRAISIPANGRMRYRFEVSVPTGAAPGECRFALLIEGRDPLEGQAGDLRFPVAGRLGVIVYVRIGTAEPVLAIVGPAMLTEGTRTLPAVRVRNSGTAHARLSGFIDGVDAAGVRYTLMPQSVPILPGQTRNVGLQAERNDGRSAVAESHGTPASPVAPPAWPLDVQGTLESGPQRLRFESRYAP